MKFISLTSKICALPFVLSFILQSVVFAQHQSPDLDDGWQMQSTVLVREEAKTVSSQDFKTKNWYPAKPGWTVLNTLTKSHVYPDMRFGMNNYRIPDLSDVFNEKHNLGRFSHLPDKQNPWAAPWWFRRMFSMENVDDRKTVWLEIDCINYRAEIWLNGRMVAGREKVAGIFERFRFDVSDFVQQGDNVLAVKIYPPDHAGEPGTQSDPLGGVRPYNTELMKDMSMVMAIGYDCFPTVRDRNTGILQGIRIRQTGTVAIRHPFVKTEMRIPKTDQATISISAELVNTGETLQKTVLRGHIEETDLAFEQSVTLNPNETRTVHIKPFFMQKPALWFPHGHGGQPLYTLSLEAVDETGTAVLDAQSVRFGVRQITTRLHEYNGGYGRQIFINGKKIFCRGGYIQPDAMLEWDRERIKAEFRYYREAGLNLIYFEDIPNPPDWFLDFCDEYGIMFGNCYFACFWMRPGSGYPEDPGLVAPAAVDITKRYRNHPSLIMYMCMNEETTREDVYAIWRNTIQEHDGTRFWIPSAYFPDEVYEKSPDWIRQDMPVGMTDKGASYGWLPLEAYFRKVREDTRWMFMMESGSASLPPIESLRLFLPDIDRKKRKGAPDTGKTDPFPLDAAWAEHGGNSYYRPYHEAIYRLFNAPNDVADYCWKGHVLTADQNRAMFEAVQHRMWDITGGLTQWKINSGWPSVQWQIFDWFHRPMVSYYYIKKANRPVHVLWSPLDDQIYAVNHRMEAFQGTVHAEVYDFDMKKLVTVKQSITVSAESSSDIGIKIARYDNLPEGVYYLKLRLADSEDSPVSDNFYWIPTNEKLTGLENLPAVSLNHTETFREEGDETVVTVTITNPSDRLAFFVRAILQKGTEEILPVFWSDNYISLLPGEMQTLEVRIATKHLSGQKPVVRLDGWNLREK